MELLEAKADRRDQGEFTPYRPVHAVCHLHLRTESCRVASARSKLGVARASISRVSALFVVQHVLGRARFELAGRRAAAWLADRVQQLSLSARRVAFARPAQTEWQAAAAQKDPLLHLDTAPFAVPCASVAVCAFVCITCGAVRESAHTTT